MAPSHSHTREFELEVYGVIEKFPGLGLRELSRELVTSAQSLKYYTDKLVREESLIVKKDGKYSRFYVKGFEIEDFEEKILSCLRKPQLLNIIIIFLQTHKNEGIEIQKNQDLIDKLHVQAGTVSYHLNQLVQSNIIEKINNGFRLRNSLLIESLVKKYYPTRSIVNNFIYLWTIYFSNW